MIGVRVEGRVAVGGTDGGLGLRVGLRLVELMMGVRVKVGVTTKGANEKGQSISNGWWS